MGVLFYLVVCACSEWGMRWFGQNRTVYVRYFWQGNDQIYSQPFGRMIVGAITQSVSGRMIVGPITQSVNHPISQWTHDCGRMIVGPIAQSVTHECGCSHPISQSPNQSMGA